MRRHTGPILLRLDWLVAPLFKHYVREDLARYSGNCAPAMHNQRPSPP